MNNVTNAKTNRLDVKSFNAIQTIKYSLKSQHKTSLELYHRPDVHYSPVDKPLCYHIRTAYGRMNKEKKEAKITASSVTRIFFNNSLASLYKGNSFRYVVHSFWRGGNLYSNNNHTLRRHVCSFMI